MTRPYGAEKVPCAVTQGGGSPKQSRTMKQFAIPVCKYTGLTDMCADTFGLQDESTRSARYSTMLFTRLWRIVL